eukprot:scaffold6493_cov217-Alexandrium_tamarense.AAC.2
MSNALAVQSEVMGQHALLKVMQATPNGFLRQDLPRDAASWIFIFCAGRFYACRAGPACYVSLLAVNRFHVMDKSIEQITCLSQSRTKLCSICFDTEDTTTHPRGHNCT